MLVDLQIAAVLADETAALVGEDDVATRGPRMRKVGGIISNQLSDRFAQIERKFMADCGTCAACGTAPREEGRLRCGGCEIAQRRAKMSDAQRAALKKASVAVRRQRLKDGEKVGPADLWGK